MARPTLRLGALSAVVALSACAAESVGTSRPPTAFAGFDRPAALGAPVVLDGRLSLDPDGDPLRYAWALVARPRGSAAALSTPDAATTELVPDAPGVYLVALTVSDGALVDRDLVAIDVGSGRPQPDLRLEVSPHACNLAFTASGLAGPCVDDAGRVALRARPEPATTTASVAWRVVRAPPGVDVEALAASADVAGDRFAFTPPALGAYWIAARLRGPAAVSAPVYATVLAHAPGPTRPTPVIAGPRTAAVRERVILDGRGSDAGDGDAFRWRLFTDPSAGTASLVDRATGCLPGRCRRFTPDTPGVYVVALEIDGATTATGAAALHTIEVSP